MNEWRPIIGFRRQYWINRDGVIKAGKFKDKRGAIHAEKIMQTHRMAIGYLGVCLGGRIDKRMCYVHRLIAEAFLPPVEGKHHVNHRDGNKLNNAPENLEWCTHQENMRHAGGMGVMMRPNLGKGEKCPASKLTLDQVQKIRELLVIKTPQRKIAKQFGVAQTTISSIAIGATWQESA